MRVTKIFEFAAAHRLPNYRGKAEPLHGHTYRLHVTVEGRVADDGMVVDFHLLKDAVRARVLSKLDHTNLNDTIENPSAENIAKWVWAELSPAEKTFGADGLRLVEITVFESPTSFVTHDGS